MKVFFGSGSNDMVMIGHENDVMNEKVIFLHGLLKRVKDDACRSSLIEPEGLVVGSADQVIGIDVLDDAKRSSHAMGTAKILPKRTFKAINLL